MRSRLIILAAVVAALASAIFGLQVGEQKGDASRDVLPVEERHSYTGTAVRNQDVSRGLSRAPDLQGISGSAVSVAVEGDAWKETLSAIEDKQARTPLVVEPPYGGVFDSLMKAFHAGDARTAVPLLSILERCDSAYRARAELEDAIDDAYDARVLRLPGQSLQEASRIPEDEEIPRAVEEGLIEVHEQCLDVPRVDSATVRDLELAAAAKGFARVAIHRGRENLRAGDAERAAQLFEQAWREGSWNALDALADVISDQSISEVPIDVLPETLGSELAPGAREYALRLAYYKIQETKVTSSSPIIARKKKAEARQLQELEAQLLPHQIEQATEAAMEVVRLNRNCCLPL